ncbi:MAG: alpha/beta hydrolase [Bdellovibrionales bacterium]|nr:alpha/beta hydrolase [Bdellovibrionales bacterium]
MKKHLPKLISFLSIFAPTLAAKFALKMFATPIRVPRPESEMEMFHISKQYFLKSGIAAFEWESHDKNPEAPVVLLIHGWNGRGTQISAFAKNLVERNFRVIALDGPGHGSSPGAMTSPTHYAKFIIDSQNEIAPNGVHSVIAHSFGGGCLVLAASRGLKTKSLVLVASPAFYDRVVDFFAKSFGLKTEKSKANFIEMVTKFAGLAPKELNIGLIGSELKLPALVVHDEGDNAVNYLSAKAIIDAWPGTKLITTSGLGHRRILKDPHVLSEVAEFIGGIP